MISFSLTSNFAFILTNNGLKIQNIQKKNNISQNNTSYMEFTKNGIYYKSNFQNKHFYEKSFFICRSNEIENENIEKDLYNEYYELNQGDLIKLGRLYIKIREICINGKILSKNLNEKKNIINRLSTTYSNNFNNVNNKNMVQIKKKNLCRVCYSDEKAVDSPLISPCKCNGGLKYIHLSCLRNWIEARAILKTNESNDECLKYEINQVNCEICQEPYPDYIYIKEKDNFYEIFDFIQMKFNNYIILETIPLNYENEKREIFVLSFDEKDSIFIGRSHLTDMKLNDITVSRYHSKIIINREKKKYYLRDMGSKFGTGILIQNPKIKINPKFPLYIQISKCSILISLIKTCNFFCSLFTDCCNSNNENKLFKYYGKENCEAIEIEKIFQFKKSNDDDNEEEENNCDYSNNESITEKTLKSKKSEKLEDLNMKDNNEEYEKLNINKNKNEITITITNNTEATLMGTFLSPENTQGNKTKSFIKKSKNNNLNNNNKDIKARIMKKLGKFSENSENIEEDIKGDSKNNYCLNSNFIDENDKDINLLSTKNNKEFYEIEENIEENNISKNSKNSNNKSTRRFKGKKGLHISINKSMDNINNEFENYED